MRYFALEEKIIEDFCVILQMHSSKYPRIAKKDSSCKLSWKSKNLMRMHTANLHRITISHIDKDGRPQSNEEHQQGVAQRAEAFAAEFGMSDCGRIMGLLHDKGKDLFEKMIHYEDTCAF